MAIWEYECFPLTWLLHTAFINNTDKVLLLKSVIQVLEVTVGQEWTQWMGMAQKFCFLPQLVIIKHGSVWCRQSKPTCDWMFCDSNVAHIPKPFQCNTVQLSTRPSNCYMGYYIQTIYECDKTSRRPTEYQITREHARQWINLVIPRNPEEHVTILGLSNGQWGTLCTKTFIIFLKDLHIR